MSAIWSKTGLLTALISRAVLARVDFPLDQFPLYTQATAAVGRCVWSQSSSFSTSFGCPSNTPALCLCTDALKSSSVMSAIRSCVYYESNEQQTKASELWNEYCQTNGGVKIIHDETRLQDIPLFTQITDGARSCLVSETYSSSITFGCSDYTLAPCLCGNSASSVQLWASASSCMYYYSGSVISSGYQLWQSYCDLNMATPASRVVGAPLTVSATATHSTDAFGYPITSATPGSTSESSGAAETTPPTSGGSTDSANQSGSSSNGSKNINWNAIGAIIGVVSILVAVAIAYWTNRKNQWFQHTVLNKLHLNQHHQPQRLNEHQMQSPGHVYGQDYTNQRMYYR